MPPYGAAEGLGEDPTSPLGAGENSALLGGNRDPVVKRDGKASMVSSVSNLANTIIGSGMLTFPLAMASAGILPGMLTCIFSGSVAAFGLYLLSLCAARAPHRRSSFFAVAQMTFPRAAVFFDAAIAAKCFGVSISYLIIIKGLMPNVVTALYHDLSSSTPPAWALSGRTWISLFMVVLVPLCFLRHLDSLRHTSYVALFSVAYLVLIVISVYYSPLEGMPERGEVHLIHFTPNFVSTFPVQVFAFTCAQNLFPIFNELKDNSQKRMNKVIGGAIGSATLTYEVIAIFGYLTFGSTVGANIIAMYPSTSLFIAIGQLAIVVLVLFSYPLQVHPCRNCLDKIFHSSEIKAQSDEGEDEVVDADHAAGEMSPLKHTLLTAAIIISGFTIAFFVDDLQMVLSFGSYERRTALHSALLQKRGYKVLVDVPYEQTVLAVSTQHRRHLGFAPSTILLQINLGGSTKTPGAAVDPDPGRVSRLVRVLRCAKKSRARVQWGRAWLSCGVPRRVRTVSACDDWRSRPLVCKRIFVAIRTLARGTGVGADLTWPTSLGELRVDWNKRTRLWRSRVSACLGRQEQARSTYLVVVLRRLRSFSESQYTAAKAWFTRTPASTAASYIPLSQHPLDNDDMPPYGAAEGLGEDPTSPLGAGENSALLGGNRDPVVKRDGKASMVSSVSNLANTIIGSGMLTFPLAMASAGILPGMLTCIFSGSVAAFGLYLLSLCAARAPHRRSSFFAVAQMTFPRAAVFFDAAIAAKCFGVSISYLIIIKGLMPNVVTALYHDLSSSTPPAWALSGRTWISLFMVVLVPLCFLRHLDSLRHTSYVALFSVAYLVLIVISVYYSPLEGMPERGEVHLIHFTPNFVSTFPVQVFAFTCAQNLFPIFNELKDNSQKRMNKVIGGAIGSATLTYEVIAIFGYLTFGSTVGTNIIAMYPSTSLFIAIGQLAIVVLVLFSYPLQVHPCRNCLDKIFHSSEVKAQTDQGEDEVVDADHAAGEMSPLKHTLLTAAIIISGFTIAFFVDDLQMVLSFGIGPIEQ
ncbi:Aa-trans domain-containing protein [Mycena chlorophos]|uniref:Aa-trans domain-containing protein n=1 Tax=Mycena chlorophos TaxID=658473 RepID=A0A8H6W9M7_MYCCL|nr:Aa-trans domain-containing protein [Mycena chlorophos]